MIVQFDGAPLTPTWRVRVWADAGSLRLYATHHVLEVRQDAPIHDTGWPCEKWAPELAAGVAAVLAGDAPAESLVDYLLDPDSGLPPEFRARLGRIVGGT